MANQDFTDGAEELVLDWLFNVGSPARPAAAFVGLFYTTPTNDDGTTGATECSGSGYARQAAAFSRSAQTLTLTSAVTFGPNGGSAWATVNGFGVWDAASGAGILAFKNLTSARSVGTGDSAEFATSALTITLD
jgi:hypothetical protein